MQESQNTDVGARSGVAAYPFGRKATHVVGDKTYKPSMAVVGVGDEHG